MKGLFAWLGFRQGAGRIREGPRAPPAKANGATGGCGTSRSKVCSRFSTLPLRIWTYAGLLMAVLALAFAMLVVGRTLVSGVDVPGYASIAALLCFFSGVNMIGLGIVGEYLGRAFTEAERRPN